MKISEYCNLDQYLGIPQVIERTSLLHLLFLVDGPPHDDVQKGFDHVSKRFSSDTHTFLITHFYYAQNLDVLILTFDRFCAIYGRQKDMRVSIF